MGPHDPSKTSAVPYQVHMRRVEEVGVDLLAALFRDEHGLAFDVLNADSEFPLANRLLSSNEAFSHKE